MSEEFLKQNLWINGDFFESILRKELKDESVFIKTFEVISVVSREQNYWTDVVEVLLNFVNSFNVKSSEAFTIKLSFYDPYMSNELEKYDTFKRELALHRDIIPKLDELLISVQDNTRFTSRAIGLSSVRPKYLFMENFGEFTKAKCGLDMEHLKVVLGKMAKFHAATAVLHSNNDHIMKYHHQGNIDENFKSFHPLFINALKACNKQVELWDDSKKYTIKLQNLEKNLIEKGAEAFLRDEDDFGVLNNGDLWLNNIVFKYNNNKRPVEVLLVDFGLSVFASPGIDLSYLLFSSSTSDIKDLEFDILIQFYHKHLHQNLIRFGYSREIPSLTQIHNEFLKYGVVGVIYTNFLLPMRFANDQQDLNELVRGNINVDMFKNQEFLSRMEFLLNYYDRKGLLD